MSGSNAKIEWYLARDGQQHGPLSDVEMTKFIELGHLTPTDLVWRAGFPEWKMASEVFPSIQPVPPPPPPPATPPQQDRADTRSSETSTADQITSVQQPQDAAPATANEPTSAQSDARAGANPAEPQSPQQQSGAPGPGGQQRFGGPGGGPGGPAGHPADPRARPAAGTNAPEAGQPGPAAAHRGAPDQRGGAPTRPGQSRGAAASWSPGQGGPQPGQRPGRMGDTTGGPAGRPFEPGQPGSRAAPNFTIDPGQSTRAPGAGPGAGPGPQAKPQAASSAHQVPSYDDDDFYDDEDYPTRRRRPAVTALVTLVLLGMIGAGGWFAYANQETFAKIISDITSDEGAQPKVVAAPKQPARVAVNAPPAKEAAPPPKQPEPVASGPAPLPLLKSQFWQSFVTAYPDWAKEQEAAAEQMRADGKSDNEVLVALVKSIVEWRRNRADAILSASPEYLRKLAQAFVSNLRFLVSQDVQACYGFISKGEVSPTVLPFFRDTEHVERLGSQTNAIVAAARDGASAKRTYSEPASGDFTELANLLIKRGWTEADLEMFSDPTKLSTAPAGKVCSLVTEWFETQLQMPASDKQMRLLATSLQPVVRG